VSRQPFEPAHVLGQRNQARSLTAKAANASWYVYAAHVLAIFSEVQQPTVSLIRPLLIISPFFRTKLMLLAASTAA
jgi:hypothetical protein